MYTNSLDKIVYSYFRAFAKNAFKYGDDTVVPLKKLFVSKLLWRGYTCPPMCGGCCPKFSLVYIPGEKAAYPLKRKEVSFNGQGIGFYEDPQDDHSDHFCRNLNKEDGRCNIHGKQPFSCDFELIRVCNMEERNQSWVGTRLFSRGWNFLTVDHGCRGAKCTITEPTEETKIDVLRKLGRLKSWMNYCGIENVLDQVIDYGENLPINNQGNLTITRGQDAVSC